MTWKTALALFVAALDLMAWSPNFGIAPALAGCMAGDRIDSSTARQATAKFEHAGYTGVHNLNKGCDNYWHAIALHDGTQNEIVLTPDGVIMLEGMSRLSAEGLGIPSDQTAQTR